MRIGHASCTENRGSVGGKAGDQTTKEVCIREYYSNNWDCMLRPKDPVKAETMARECEKACLNDNVGYSQDTRNTLRTQAQKVNFDLSKVGLCNCDCSSFMSVCAECAGIAIPYKYGNAPTTSSMKIDFLSTGEFDLYTDKIYLNSPNFLKRGDILVKTGSHTVMILENGSLANNIVNAPTKAIDVSKYNTITDYKILASQISTIIIRIGYRASASGKITEDDLFKKHIDNCVDNGMNIGIYFYDQSINEKEAIEQADWVVNRLKGYNINLPIFIDSEYANSSHNGRADNISKEQRTKNLVAFCNRIQELGYTAGTYASNSWYKSMVNFDQLKNYNVWCARYSTQKPDISKYDIWQYGSEQFIWSNKPIDVNYIYNLSSNVNTSVNEPNNPIKNDININSTVNASSLNVRRYPNMTSPILYKLKRNEKVTIYGYVTDWYTINKELTEWVSKDYIVTTKGKVTATKLNYRQDVGINSKLLGQYNKGDIVNILNSKKNENSTWYLCLGSNDKFGWVSGDYISPV